MKNLIDKHENLHYEYLLENDITSGKEQCKKHANITAETAIGFAEWIKEQNDKGNMKMYEESKKWVYWQKGNAFGSQLTTSELFTIYINQL